VFVDAAEPAMPCGICRQSMIEFCDDAIVICAAPAARIVTNIRELLPRPFKFAR
jgi:cytidine deaminase